MNSFLCMYENVVYKNFNRERERERERARERENISYIFIGPIFSASTYRKYKLTR